MDSEKLLPLPVAIEKATGWRPHLTTCLRWCQRGSRGVFLESHLLGGRRLTSVEAVIRFRNATTAASDRRPKKLATNEKQRQREIQAAEQSLRDMGV